MKTALKLFAARGYDVVGVQEIVEATGITKPTLYHYFGSKQGLLKAVVTEYFDRLIQSIQEAADYHGDLTLSLTRVALAYFDFARQNPTYYRMQLSMWLSPPENEAHQVVSTLNYRQHQLIEDLFRQAVKEHGNMRGRHQAYAATFIGMINTYIGLWLNGYIEDLNDDLVYPVVHQFEHGIYS